MRLFFHTFSASGGTGSGAAAEFMRAQRFAVRMRRGPEHKSYCSAIAVFPSSTSWTANQEYRRNCGRLLIQYLADMNIRLKDKVDFNEAPKCDYSIYIASDNNENKEMLSDEEKRQYNKLIPWHSMAIVSNDIMDVNTIGEDIDLNLIPYDRAQFLANVYIAQQINNISSAQLPIAQQATAEDIAAIGSKGDLFDSIMLDPNDLCTGLIGPYFIGYSCRSTENASRECLVEEMFLDAIRMPSIYESKDKSKVALCGISVLPEDKNKYKERLMALFDSKLEKIDQQIYVEGFRVLGEGVEVFEKCPRAVAVFTVPAGHEKPGDVIDRIQVLTSCLLPNVTKVRIAVVYGTTKMYSLSLYFEGSVLLSPMIRRSITNYLAISFRNRNLTAPDFSKKFEEILSRDDLISVSDEDLADIMVEREEFERSVPSFEHLKKNWMNAWHSAREEVQARLVDQINIDIADHAIEDHLLTRKEVAAALSYLHYVQKFQKDPII